MIRKSCLKRSYSLSSKNLQSLCSRERCLPPIKPRRSSWVWKCKLWWFNPEWPWIFGIILAIFLIFALLTWLYFIYSRQWIHEELFNVTTIYLDIFSTLFVTIGFYLLIYGIYISHRNEILNTVDLNKVSLDRILAAHAPYSNRLAAQIYPCNCILQAVAEETENSREKTTQIKNEEKEITEITEIDKKKEEKEEEKKKEDEAHQRFVEIVIVSIIYSSINELLDFRPIPPMDEERLFRSWFKSKLVREQWPLYRQFYRDATVKYIEQNCFPDIEKNVAPGWAIFLYNGIIPPFVFITVFFIVGSIIFWYVWYFDTVEHMIEIYTQATRALFIASALFLIFYNVQNTSLTTQHEILENADFGLKTRALDNYPSSAKFYQQLYQTDCDLIAIVPAGPIDLSEQQLIEASIASLLFETIDETLKIIKPTQAQVREWRSWAQSCIFNQFWKANSRFFTCETRNFIFQYILPSCNPCTPLTSVFTPAKQLPVISTDITNEQQPDN